MRKAVLALLMTFSCTLICSQKVNAQEVFINDFYDVYQLDGPVGSCQYKSIGNFGISETLMSLALHNDTLYILSSTSELYQVDLKTYFVRDLDNLSVGPNPYLIALTCAKNGQLIGVEYNYSKLIQYDPYTKSKIIRPFSLAPDGDLIYFQDKLLYAGDGPFLYSIDLNNPSASTQWMSTGRYNFYGLFAMPGDCNRNRFFGVTRDQEVIEIDPVNRKIVGLTCHTPFIAADAASNLEDGTFVGPKIEDLGLTPSCIGQGKVAIVASAGPGTTVTYTLDGNVINSTGLFTNVSSGSHEINVNISGNCLLDTAFDLTPATPNYAVTTSEPLDCMHNNGSMTITPADPAASWQYSINGGPPQPSGVFSGLADGNKKLSIFYGEGCEKDTNVMFPYQNKTPFPVAVTPTPTTCSARNGTVAITVPNSGLSTATLDGVQIPKDLTFQGLDSGFHVLHLNMDNGCQFDSIVNVVQITNERPAISAVVTDQQCFLNNGNIALSIIGNYGPYQSSLDNQPFVNKDTYGGLAPSIYSISVRDLDGCLWDSSYPVKPYQKTPVNVRVDSVEPICNLTKSGSLTVAIEGDQNPYQFNLGGDFYGNGATIGGLEYGVYPIYIQNKDGCIVDTVDAKLDLVILPACMNVYVPSAFSPNGNGINDKFRVVHDPLIVDVQLQVFNRWGGLIFDSTPQHPAWDGYYRGIAQPAGTYVWKVSYVDHDKKRKMVKGTVLLIR